MNAPEQNREEDTSNEAPRVRGLRGRTGLAWLALVILVGAAIIVPRLLPEPEEPTEAPGVRIGEKLMELQARMYITLADMGPEGDRRRVARHAERNLNVGSVNQRQRFIALIAELKDAEAAHDHLRELDELIRLHTDARDPDAIELTEAEARVMRILHLLYAEPRPDGEPPRVELLDQTQRNLLKDELGWFGRLALVPRNGPDAQARAVLLRKAHSSMVGASILMVLLLLAGLAGFIGLIIFLVLALTGRIRNRVQPMLSPRECGAHHGVYAETFAVWFALFFGFSIAAAMVGEQTPQHRILFIVAGFLLSLTALAWPVVRGVPWRTLRSDIGLHLGDRPALEPFIGAAGYLMTLPMFAVGLVLTILLFLFDMMMRPMFGPEPGVFDEQVPAAHPVLEHVLGPDLWPKIQVYLAVSIAAPIVEEIMFRGVFHRHLRGATRYAGPVASIIWSTVVVSFIFAAIHPVPWVAIPALMSLAFGFSLLREWRGTLVPAMVAHAIHNGFIVTMVLLVLML